MLDERAFEAFLKRDPQIWSKEKAVSSRMSRARKVEDILKKSLDAIVADDDEMFKALSYLGTLGDSNLANVTRKYYIFKNSKEFPKLKDYCSRNRW